MLVASAHCPNLAGRNLGITIPPEFMPAAQAAQIEQAKVTAAAGADAEQALRAGFAADYAKTVVPNYTVAGPGPLTDREKILQKIILARDYDTLFRVIPLSMWKPRWQLGKYSFVGNGTRRYVPFSEADISRFIFSKYYTVQPGYTCPQSQLEQGFAAHWGKTQGHKARYPASDWKHIWPMYPGGGYPGQTYGCEKYRPSTWVKMRKKVYVAAAIVAAVYLGPIVMTKIGGLLGGGATGGTAGAAAGAGAATGATSAGAAVGAGVAAGTGATTAGGIAGAAVKAGTFLSTVQQGVDYYNKATTVNAMIKGKAPPPPVDITGSSFTEWGMNVAKDLAAQEIKEETGEYFAEKLTAQQEAIMRAELEALQRQMGALVPRGTPAQPDPNLQPQVREKIAQMQNVERDRESASGAGVALALGLPLIAFAMAG